MAGQRFWGFPMREGSRARYEAHKRGVMLFTGATAGVKAGARSISFGPAKFAMRVWRSRWRGTCLKAIDSPG